MGSMKSSCVRPLFVGLGVVLAGWVHGQTYKDILVPKKGSALEDVEVTEETYVEITYTPKTLKQVQKFTSPKVQEIKHGDQPSEYHSAMTKLQNGDYDGAIESFKKSAAAEKVRPWIHPYTKFRLGQCYQSAGRCPEALQAFQQLLKDHPNHLLVPDGHFEMANCTIELGGDNLVKATESLNTLGKQEFGEEWNLMAQDGHARILEAQKQFDAAADRYRALIASAKEKKYSNVVNLAYRGFGRCLLKANKPEEAVKVFNELRNLCIQTEDAQGLAIAYNGLGDCLFKTGMFEDAALQHMRVNILYGEKEPEEDSRALYQSGQCYRQLSLQKGIEKDKKSLWQTRSLELLKEVAGKYPGTAWGKLAKGEL